MIHYMMYNIQCGTFCRQNQALPKRKRIDTGATCQSDRCHAKYYPKMGSGKEQSIAFGHEEPSRITTRYYGSRSIKAILSICLTLAIVYNIISGNMLKVMDIKAC